jgi:hypothetical protein
VNLKFDDFASDFDLLIDVDELQNQSQGPDGESLDRIALALDDGYEADDSCDFEVGS